MLAFSVRAVYVVNNQSGIEQDEREYDRLARDLLLKKAYVNSAGGPTSFRPPVYPSFLALIYKIFGRNILIARLVQAIIGSITVCLFYLIAENIFNRTTALLSGIFTALYMIFIFYTKFMLSETFFSFILALTIYLIITVKGPGLIRFFLIGLSCGALTLTRSSGLFMPAITFIVFWNKAKTMGWPGKKTLPVTLALLISFAAVITPWTVRNYMAHKAFVPISTNGGLNMYQAVHPVDGKIPEMGPRRDAVADKGFLIQDEVKRNNYFLRQAIEVYKNDFRGALKSYATRFLFFWNIIDWNATDGNIINYHFIFIMPFAIFGIVFSLKNRKNASPILLTILYFFSLILLFQGAPRFRMPIDGYIIIFGAYGIYELVKRAKKKIYSLGYISFYFTLTYFLYINSLSTKYFLRGIMERIGLW